jgi:hypothetical protein
MDDLAPDITRLSDGSIRKDEGQRLMRFEWMVNDIDVPLIIESDRIGSQEQSLTIHGAPHLLLVGQGDLGDGFRVFYDRVSVGPRQFVDAIERRIGLSRDQVGSHGEDVDGRPLRHKASYDILVELVGGGDLDVV